MPVDLVADRVGSSSRHLRRTVRRRVGISLKRYGRPMRPHREEWRTIMRVLVERTWRGVRGQG